MRAVVQRVSQASVAVDGAICGQIARGLLVFLGVEEKDTRGDMLYLAEKIPHLRIFEDEAGKMNRSLWDINGGLLVISQFTLLGDARGGRRPSFITAARPETAIPLYEALVEHWQSQSLLVQTGIFGADMAVSLINDGPVTLLLDSRKLF